jgi:hypothetical protein
MSDDEEVYGVTLLAPLREQPPPPSRVDIATAIRTGNHRRRVRMTLAGTACLVVVVLVAVGIISTLPTAGTTAGGSTEAGMFDPLIRNLDVTPVAGFVYRAFTAEAVQQTIMLVRSSATTDSFTQAKVTIYAVGKQPNTLGFDWSWPTTLAEPVHGRASYSFDDCDPVCGAGLVWQWRADSWASVIVEGPDNRVRDPQGLSAARQIAAATQTGVSIPVRTPMTVPRPAGMRVVAFSDGPAVRVVFNDPPGPNGPNGPAPPHMLQVTAFYRLGRVTSTTMVDGHPAHVERGNVTVLNLAGDWSLEVLDTKPDQNPFASTDSLVRYARTVRFVANPDDRSTWVSPLR